MSTRLITFLLGSLGGLAAMLLLVVGWQAMGWAAPVKHPDYHLTETISHCLGAGFAAGYLLLAAGLGLVCRSSHAIAFGMVLPWPVAAAIEVAHDPTDHNLWPFELLMLWAPAYLIAYFASRLARNRLRPDLSSPAA